MGALFSKQMNKETVPSEEVVVAKVSEKIKVTEMPERVITKKRASKEGRTWEKLQEKMQKVVPVSGVKVDQQGNDGAGKEEKTVEVEVGDTLRLDTGMSLNVEELLAQGTFATVFRTKTDTMDHCHALRLVHHPQIVHMEACMREVEILQHLGYMDAGGEHLSLTYLFFSFGKGETGSVGHICELLETPLADVLDILRESDALHPAAVRTIGYQVTSALKFLHEHGVTHCDVKPDNVMFCNLQKEKLKVKVIDLGNSYFTATLPQGSTMQNLFYRCPEAIFGLPVNEKMDIWCLGCLLIEMYTGHDLFFVEEEPELARYIEALVGLPANINLCPHKNKFFKWDEKQNHFRVFTHEETTNAKIKDKEDSTQVITDFSEIPYLAYSYIHGMGATDEDDQFVEVVSQMMTANSAPRLSSEEVLRSLFFRDFDFNYNTVNERNEPLADILIQIIETGEPCSAKESPVSHEETSD